MINPFFRKPTVYYSLFFCLFLLTGIGCGGNSLETEYAKPRGKSLNGISTFLQLLRTNGHRVETVRFLSPRLMERGEFLVIFHDSPGPLDQESQKAIQELCQSPWIHSVLLVLKNGDMTEQYFDALKKRAQLDSDQLKKTKEALDSLLEQKKLHAKTEEKPEFSVEEGGGLYGLKKVERPPTEKPIMVDILPEPDTDWDKIHKSTPDIGKISIPAQWRLERRLIPDKETFVRWSSGEDPLLTQGVLLETRFFVLSSAIPLLNAGLTDPGNRVLCEEIASLIPPNTRVIVSTSSHWRGAGEEDPPDGGILRFLRVHPYPWIFVHALLAIIFFCWWKYPILGRPRSENGSEVKRFARHIDALGDLLGRTGDRSYILMRIREWQRVRNNPK
jgi:hypothetical protein